MTADAEAEKKEKSSFLKKHASALFIAIMAAIVGATITVAATEYFKYNPVRELLVAQDGSVSLINGDLPSQIMSNYFLTEEPTKKIKSLFFKKIAIKNNGNEDGENLPFSVFLKGNNIFLIDNPTIKTEPKEIIDIIKIKKEANSTNTKHIWNIPLLKPGETITFEYMIYSEEKVKAPKINVLVRKKSWESKKGVFSNSTTQNSSIVGKILVQFSAVIATATLLTGALFVLGIKVTEKIKNIKKEKHKNIEAANM